MKTLALLAALLVAVPSFAQSHQSRGRHGHQHRAPQPPPGPTAMSDGDFANLVWAVNAEPFSDRKMAVVQTAASSAYFTVGQVGQLIDLMTFSSEQLGVVSVTQAHILDRYNAYQLYAHFVFDCDKQQVGQMLGI